MDDDCRKTIQKQLRMTKHLTFRCVIFVNRKSDVRTSRYYDVIMSLLTTCVLNIVHSIMCLLLLTLAFNIQQILLQCLNNTYIRCRKAEQCKASGNTCYKSKDYLAAVRLYTEAIGELSCRLWLSYCICYQCRQLTFVYVICGAGQDIGQQLFPCPRIPVVKSGKSSASVHHVKVIFAPC